jgi:hypothetical protein
VTLLCSVLLAGCMAPAEPAKQAEEISSIAGEGSLLAHEVVERDVTTTFTRVHAEALRKKLSELEPKVQVDALARLLHDADAELAGLEDESGGAGEVERRLERIAKQADELAK